MTGFLLMMVGGGLVAAAIKFKAHWIITAALIAALIVLVLVTPDGHHVTSSLVTFAKALGGV